MSDSEVSVKLRPVLEEDEDFLRRVYAETREEEMAIVPWDDQQKAAFLDMQYRAQKMSYWADFPESAHSIILADGEPVGRIWVDENEKEIRLIDVALLAEERRRGVGSILLERLQDRARQAGVPLRHMVLKTNTEAMRFYERLGFSVIDEIPTHYTMEWTAEDAAGPT